MTADQNRVNETETFRVVNRDDIGITEAVVEGGSNDGTPVGIIDAAQADLIVIVHRSGAVHIRSAIPQGIIIHALRAIADAYEAGNVVAVQRFVQEAEDFLRDQGGGE